NVLTSRITRQSEEFTEQVGRISAPTLILQAVGDRQTTFENAGMVAALVPDSRVVPLDSRNHILLADEPAWQTFIREVTAVMDPDRQAVGSSTGAADTLRRSGVEVLRA